MVAAKFPIVYMNVKNGRASVECGFFTTPYTRHREGKYKINCISTTHTIWLSLRHLSWHENTLTNSVLCSLCVCVCVCVCV